MSYGNFLKYQHFLYIYKWVSKCIPWKAIFTYSSDAATGRFLNLLFGLFSTSTVYGTFFEKESNWCGASLGSSLGRRGAKWEPFRSERVGIQHNICSPLQVLTSEDFFFQKGMAALLESVQDKMFILNSFHTFPEEMWQVLHEATGIFLKSYYLYKI